MQTILGSKRKPPATSASPSVTGVQHRNLHGNELARFRTKICEQHRRKSCLSADSCADSHCQTWQRRNPNEYMYSSKLCPEIEFIKKGHKMTLVRRCSRGRRCMFAHSKEEELYHPNMYKTKMCNSHPYCTRYYCPFAHSEEELRKPAAAIVSPPSSPISSAVPSLARCPASPVSGSTTASSAAASLFLSSFSPISNTVKAAPDEKIQCRSATKESSRSSIEKCSIDRRSTVGMDLPVIPQASTESDRDNLYNMPWEEQSRSAEAVNTPYSQMALEEVNIPILTKECESSRCLMGGNCASLFSIGLINTEQILLERLKFGDESSASLAPCDPSTPGSSLLPPGLFGLFNSVAEEGRPSHKRNLNPHRQCSYDARSHCRRSHDPRCCHNDNPWYQNSNRSNVIVPYYGGQQDYNRNRNRVPDAPLNDWSYSCAISPSSCQFNSNRISNGRHYPGHHEFEEGNNLTGKPGKQDLGVGNYQNKNYFNSIRESSVSDSDPLALLSALTFLNSLTPRDGECLESSDTNDDRTLLIAEILEHLARSSCTNADDNTVLTKTHNGNL